MGKRYLCERCGTGRIAPGRMAPDDVRRFCLPCSEATGKLVPLICPARERAKERTRQRAADRAKAERERETQAKYILPDGSDIRVLFNAVKGLKVWRAEGGEVLKAVKNCKVDRKPNREPKTGDLYVLHAIATVSATAAFWIGGDEWSNKQFFILACAVEYFGLDPNDLKAIRETTMAVKFGTNWRENVISPDWLPFIRQALAGRSARKDTT